MRNKRTQSRLATANLVLAFLLELAALGGFALLAALVPDGWLRFVAGLAGMAVFVLLWAIWAAPRSKRRLRMPALLVFKAGMFLVAALGYVAAGQVAWAAVFVVLSAVNFALMGYLRRW